METFGGQENGDTIEDVATSLIAKHKKQNMSV